MSQSCSLNSSLTRGRAPCGRERAAVSRKQGPGGAGRQKLPPRPHRHGRPIQKPVSALTLSPRATARREGWRRPPRVPSGSPPRLPDRPVTAAGCASVRFQRTPERNRGFGGDPTLQPAAAVLTHRRGPSRRRPQARGLGRGLLAICVTRGADGEHAPRSGDVKAAASSPATSPQPDLMLPGSPMGAG